MGYRGETGWLTQLRFIHNLVITWHPVDGVLVDAGSLLGPRCGPWKPQFGETKVGRNENTHTQSGSLTKTHHRGTPSKSNRKPDVAHAPTVRFQLAIWISRHQRRPTFVCRRDFTKTVGSQTHPGDQRWPTSVPQAFQIASTVGSQTLFFLDG